MKLKEVPVSENNTIGNFVHWCPGCECLHLIPTKVKNENNAIWKFDGNVDSPTFSPSVHIHFQNSKNVRQTKCHYFIQNGLIKYCGDSEHSFKGQTIELPHIPNEFL